MLSQWVIWTAFGLYLCFLLAVAFVVTVRRRRGASKELLGASVSWPVLVMTYLSSLMSTWVFFAGPGAYYRGGIGYWISEMSYIALFPVIAHFTMNKVWIISHEKRGAFVTPADFYCERFRSQALRVILALIFLACSFPYIASVLVAIAQGAQYATGGAVSYRLTVVVVGLIMTLFVCVGGVQSAATADTVQGLLFITLLWAIVICCLAVGFDGSLATVARVVWENPDTTGFFSLPGPNGWTTYALRLGYPLSCAIGWTIMLPHVFVRSGYYGDNLQAQRRLSFLTPPLQALVWTGTMLVGMIGLAVTSDMTSAESELIIPYLIQNLVDGSNHALAMGMMVGFFVGATAVGLSTANAFLGVASAIIENDFLDHTLHIRMSALRGF